MATQDDMITLVEIQLSTSAPLLSTEGLISAIVMATTELGWSLPETDPVRIYWITKRALRHSCYILYVASAQAFKYKQVNLQNRFEHYSKLIENMDKEWEAALTSQPTVFSGNSADNYKQFGTAIDSGFVYGSLGEDLTYTDYTKYLVGN